MTRHNDVDAETGFPAYTVGVLATDALERAELSARLADEGLFVLAELGLEDNLEPYTEDLEVLVWAVDLADTLDDLPSVPLLALAGDADEAAHALRQGALGVVERDLTGERLHGVLAALTWGLAVLEPRYLRPAPAPDGVLLEPLTPREYDVLELLAEGLSNKAIAKRLGVSDHTVKFHLNALLSKLAATTRTEAVTRAVRAGLLTL